MGLQPLLNIVCIQDGVLRSVGESIGSHHCDISVGYQEDGSRSPRGCRYRVDAQLAADADHRMVWQKGHQMFRYADRAHAGSATTVRNTERLVQIEVADIRADKARVGKSYLRVHIGSVH